MKNGKLAKAPGAAEKKLYGVQTQLTDSQRRAKLPTELIVEERIRLHEILFNKFADYRR